MVQSSLNFDIEAVRKGFQANGAAIVRKAFSQSWLDKIAAGIEEALAAPGPHGERYGPQGAERFFGDLDMWQRHKAFKDYVLHSPAGELAGQVMDAQSATFLYDQMLVKEPGSQQRTPWHQDQPYWAVKGRQVCSIWMPLDPVPKDVSLEFVRSSHASGQAYNPQRFDTGRGYEGTGLPPLPDIEGARADYDILSWGLEPGDCIIFHAMTIHGAPANPHAARRRVLTTRWLGDDARYVKPKGEYGAPTTEPDFPSGSRFSGPLYPTVWTAS